jgi:flagellar biosynthesis protein FlhF
VDQLQMVASIARTPLEVVYDVREVDAAMRRLAAAGCEVILIDTPGRSPRAQELNAEWRSLLQAARPDETHLVLPAAMRPDVAMAMKAGFATPRLTHLLFSKLDELPTDAGLADLAHRVGLPTRWLTDGQTIPDDLRPAPARILTSLTASEIEPAAVLA